MNSLSRAVGPKGYKIIKMPAATMQSRAYFDDLPADPYHPGRCREFSQYIFYFGYEDWVAQALPHRPLVQSKLYNSAVGGLARDLHPVRQVNPIEQFRRLADVLDLDRDGVFQLNFHQWRSFSPGRDQIAMIPEGVHRDGHHITSITVWRRENIDGGETTLFRVGETEPFFCRVLEPGECLILSDADLIHGAKDIRARDANGGFRDIWVISVNPWNDRKYGHAFEKFSLTPQSEKECG